MSKDTVKVATYARYSSTNQSETSIEFQHEHMKQYCDRKGYKIIKQYVDEARTGTNDGRKQFQQMLADAKRSPEWSVLLVYDYDRFARNMRDSINHLEMLTNQGIMLLSVNQPFMDITPEQTLNRNILFAYNAYFSEKLSKVMRDSMKVKAAKCEHCGGKPPLGYDIDNEHHLVINKQEADTVRKIFKMFELGYSYNRMAKYFNSKGITTKTGNEFTKHSFYGLLRQEKYIGIFVWNKEREKRKGKRNSHESKPIEEQIRIIGGCPAIIDPQVFARVQATLEERKTGHVDTKNRYHYMFKNLGILKCSCCGADMTGISRRNRSGNYTVYACPNKGKGCNTKDIRTEHIDRFVSSYLAKELYKRDDLHRISVNIKRGDDYEKLVGQKKQKETAIRNVLKAIETNTSEELIKRLAKLEQEKRSIARAIDVCQATAKDLCGDNLKATCKAFREYICISDDPDVKEYLQSAVKSVTVSNDGVEVVLNVS